VTGFEEFGLKRTAWRARPVAAGLLALATLLTGCAIDAEDLDLWEKVAEGDGRLAAYLSDTTRPTPLRAKALAVLIKMNRLDHIMGVLKVADPEERVRLLQMYAHAITTILTKMHTLEEQATAATLGYDILEHVDELVGKTKGTGEVRDKLLVDTLVDWCLEQRARPKDERARPGRKIDDILLAALAVRPEIASPRILDKMRAADDAAELLSIDAMLSKVNDAGIRSAQARHLLGFAQKVHPNVPPPVARAMVANRNETLLHYLLDAARDPRVPPATRQAGLAAAKQYLKDGALPGLFLLLQADDPASRNIMRLNALDLAWDFGGDARLADALQALPAEGTWWPEGVQFRVNVDGFCDDKLGPARDAVKPTLERLVDDPNWVTRTYAMRCVERLYPDEAAVMLAPLVDDETPLPGWSAEGPTTIGAHATAIVEAAAEGG